MYFVSGAVAAAAVAVLIGGPILHALNRWADGQPVDWMGFAAVAGILAPLVAQIVAQGAQWMHTRSRERRDEIAFGGSAPPPFAPSEPPADTWPRPGENTQ